MLPNAGAKEPANFFVNMHPAKLVFKQFSNTQEDVSKQLFVDKR